VKKIAILQSNYIPWKGYFDLIASVDEFILYDDMQYTRRDWRNRNKIKSQHGLNWLSIPVHVTGKYFQTIRETEVVDSDWAAKHWETIRHAYTSAPRFAEFQHQIANLYVRAAHETLLSRINYIFLTAICGFLGIQTRITWSSDYVLAEGKTERLIDLCQQAGGTEYVSGPSAKNYVDETMFEEAGIKLTWFEYSGYPEYPQLWGEFTHGVTILDLLLNCGSESARYIRHVTP